MSRNKNPGIPHTRGDEPCGGTNSVSEQIVFPTHVGMNRGMGTGRRGRYRIPHTRGDEPSSIRK